MTSVGMPEGIRHSPAVHARLLRLFNIVTAKDPAISLLHLKMRLNVWTHGAMNLWKSTDDI